MKFELKKTGNWSYFSIPQLEELNITHGFFTKASPSHVLKGDGKNMFLDTFFLKDLIIMHQEHGDRVHTIRNGERPESGDAIILLEKGVAGIIKTADCLPIIICEPDVPIISIIHAGWRGTSKRITQKTVRKMSALGVAVNKLVALLGPSIGSCCYEIREDVYNMFKQEGFTENIFRRTEHALFLDLKKANIEMLRNEGIEEIYDTGLCTYCDEDLFNSYRRGDRDKRQINFVSLKG